jgi:hypothetical protein
MYSNSSLNTFVCGEETQTFFTRLELKPKTFYLHGSWDKINLLFLFEFLEKVKMTKKIELLFNK